MTLIACGLRGFRAMPLVALLVAFSLPQAVLAQSGPKIEIVPITQHSMVATVAFSPDGTLVLSGGFDSTMKLWEVATGRLLRTFLGHSQVVRSVAFSPDGTKALSGSQDHEMKLWDVTTGQVVRTFTGHTGTINSVAFSADGARIVSGSRSFRGDDNRIRVWDAVSGQLLRTIASRTGEVNSVRFSPDGSKILSGAGSDPWVKGVSPAVKIWDATSGQMLRSIEGFKDEVSSVAWSPDGRRLIAGSWDKSIKLWDASTGQLLRSFAGHTQRVESVAFSPDGNSIISASIDYSLKLWDIQSGKLLRSFEGHTSAAYSVAFSPNGALLISGSGDNSLKLWSVATGRLIRTMGGDSAAVNAVAFSTDGSRVVSGSDGENTAVKLWDIQSGRLLEVLPNSPPTVKSVAFSRNGDEIQSGGYGAVKIWNAANGGALRGFEEKSVGQSFAFSPDTTKVLAGTFEGNAKLIDIPTGKLVRTFKHPTKSCPAGQYCARSLYSVAFSPDGNRVITGGEDSIARAWDAGTGRPLQIFPLNWGYVNSAQFSPDGATVLTGQLDGGVRLWSMATGKLLHLFDGNSPITSAVFSPDGSKIASGSWDRMVRLWETSSGRLLRTLEGHAGTVQSVAFSPDGTRIASVSNDTTIRIWKVESGELIATIVGRQDGEWLVITPEGFFNASARGGELLTIVRGLESFSIDQFYQSLYRPDLVREKLAGDPRGAVRLAAANLDLAKVGASGSAPVVRIISPADRTAATGQAITARAELTVRDGGIGRIEWRVNGLTVGVDTSSGANGSRSVAVTRNLALEPGDNIIEIVAYNGANLIASAPARVGVSVAPSGPTAAKTSRLFVLAAGLNNYADERFRLTYSVADAQSMAKALANSGSGLYRSVETRLLSDGDVVTEKLDAAFTELGQVIQLDDVFVLYLAGHGKTVDGRYYFIPQNFRVNGDVAGPPVDAAVKSQGVSQEQWQRWLARIPARKSLILFDTCESGTLAEELRTTKMLERGAANDRLAQATGRSIITASSGSTEAFEGYRGHGLFTYNVLDALNRGDGDGNGTIEIAELAAYVYAQVTAISERVYRQRQEPQVKINLNYSLTRQARVLEDDAPVTAATASPTFQLTQAAALQVKPGTGATVVRSLSPKAAVTVIRSEDGWSLVASGGKPLGYVATRDLAPVQ